MAFLVPCASCLVPRASCLPPSFSLSLFAVETSELVDTLSLGYTSCFVTSFHFSSRVGWYMARLFSYSVVYRSYVAWRCITIVGMFYDGATVCLLSIGEELRSVLEAWNADGWNGTAPFGIPRQRTSMNERKNEKKENNVPIPVQTGIDSEGEKTRYERVLNVREVVKFANQSLDYSARVEKKGTRQSQ